MWAQALWDVSIFESWFKEKREQDRFLTRGFCFFAFDQFVREKLSAQHLSIRALHMSIRSQAVDRILTRSAPFGK